MGMEFVGGQWKLICGGCRRENPQAWQQVADFESCDACGHVLDTSPRDAVGQKVRVPTDALGKYSYAVGEVVHSSRQYADILRRENLALKKP